MAVCRNQNNLELNMPKTEEMTMDFRQNASNTSPAHYNEHHSVSHELFQVPWLYNLTGPEVGGLH